MVRRNRRKRRTDIFLFELRVPLSSVFMECSIVPAVGVTVGHRLILIKTEIQKCDLGSGNYKIIDLLSSYTLSSICRRSSIRPEVG